MSLWTRNSAPPTAMSWMCSPTSWSSMRLGMFTGGPLPEERPGPGEREHGSLCPQGLDLSLRDVEGVRWDPKEDEADEWAEKALIPEAVWQASRVQDHPSPLAVMELAQRFSIHPAIVAGRVRHETRDFRLLSHFVGTGA